jgi:glycosyltransferase involved in cell wall biosynthesis
MNDRPLISVITPCLNRVQFIHDAIESVLAQQYEPFEHIIMDGGSTDGTIELLASYPHLHVVSEPDRGVYDSLNKGIAMARGEIIAQLNTDDVFEPGVIPAIAEQFRQYPDVDALSGGARVFERHPDGNQTIAVYDGISADELPYRATIGVAVFNGWFFRKNVFERIGAYSLDYPLIADRDFLIRCQIGKIKVMPVHTVVYHYLQHSGSMTINSQSNLQPPYLNEKLRLAEKYIHSKSSDPALKKYCIEWHNLTAIELLITFVRQKQLFSALKVIGKACMHNPRWPFAVLVQSPTRIRNYLRKRNAANH